MNSYTVIVQNTETLELITLAVRGENYRAALSHAYLQLASDPTLDHGLLTTHTQVLPEALSELNRDEPE
jgi:hypothetical protein